MVTTKKPAPRRPAGKKGPANGRTSRKVSKARKPRSDKGTKVAKGGTPAPQHVVLPPVPAPRFTGTDRQASDPRQQDYDQPMDGVRRPSVTDALPRISLELDDHDISVTRRLLTILGVVIVVALILLMVGCTDRESIAAENSAQASGNSDLVASKHYRLGGWQVHEFISSEGAHCVIAAGHLECAFSEGRP